MKYLIALSTLFTINAFAADSVIDTYQCKLDSSVGPIQHFTMKVEREMDEDYGGKITKVIGLEGEWTYEMENGTELKYDSKDKYSSLWITGDDWYEQEINYEFIDWASTSFKLGRDDEGAYAYVEMGTDGPSLVGLYRCDKSTIEL